ncbi:MAG: hypothetical protein EKK53_26810 [Burkholderiales bacterium]|nr:MAG: hypothetical protein EKK53_26810 [Burkholderiales bacterium]
MLKAASSRRHCLQALLALSAAPLARAATPAETIRAAAQAIVTDVLARCGPGVKTGSGTPVVAVRAEPFLIGVNLDVPVPELVVPPAWTDLPPPLQQVFSDWVARVGGPVPAATFFDDTFHWALVAHEMAHFLIERNVPKARRWNFYGEEAQANRFMVAFWQAQPVMRERLARCGAVWVALRDQLPSPVPPGADAQQHFERNYQALSEDPNAYGWYQFKWMADAWVARESLGFSTVLAETLAGQPRG